MRIRIAASVFLFMSGVVLLFIPQVSAAVAEPFIYKSNLISTPIIPNAPYNTHQTALKAGNTLTLQVWVHSNHNPPPSLVADFSAIGFSDTTTVTGVWGGYAAQYYPAYHYTFGPLPISADIPDGAKEVPLIATDAQGGTDATTTQIIIDNVEPTLTLDQLTFPDAPDDFLNFSLSGSVDGTGSAVRAGKLTIELFDAAGRSLGVGFTSGRYGADIAALNASFDKPPGAFSAQLQFFGLADLNDPTIALFKFTLFAYDQAGNIASSSISVPLVRQPPVPSVLFLPGLEASRLYSDEVGKVWEPSGDANAENIEMNPDGTAVREGIYTRDVIDSAYVPVKGNVYKSFLEHLELMQEEGLIHDYSAAPYDWRLSLDEILDTGRKASDGKIYYSGPFGATSTPYLIEELRRLATISGTGKVTVIAHSNGGLLAKALVERLGGEAATLIDKLIFVAVPQAGTPKAVGALLHGFEQVLPVKPLSLFGLSEAMARELARNMGSVYNLIPSENYFTYTDDPVITISDDPLLAPWRAAYAPDGTIHSGERLHNFLTDPARTILPAKDALTVPIVGNEALLDASETVHAAQDFWTPPSGIELIEIAGWGMPTLKTIAYYEGIQNTCTLRNSVDHACLKMFSTPVLEYKPEMTSDGDGTVVIPSALWTPNVSKYWVDLADYDSLFTIERKHADILEIPELRSFIHSIITGSNEGSLPTFVYTSTPPTNADEDRLRFTLHSPLTINLYDDQGNHTGFSTTTNSLEENIPGSHFLTFGEVQYVSVPASASTRLIMEGYEDGSFTLDIEETEGDSVTGETSFAGVPSFSDTVVTMDIPAGAGIEGASDLQIDVQGDGAVDIELEPLLNETVIFRIPYEWDGFLQPINDTEHHPEQSPSVFKGGSTIPVKFQIRNGEGIVTQAEAPPEWLPPERGTKMNATVDEPAYSISATSGSTYRWDPESGQYIYNWNTKGFDPGYWYTIYAKLDDGNTYSVTVGLR